MTHDRRFILKEIDRKEKDSLYKMAEKYDKYLEENPKSLLCRIYGLFSLKLPDISKFFFIVMNNFDCFSQNKVVFRYDLKFSEVNRKHVEASKDLLFI
jgi:1-phosphatidylinositol-4-phosphate 5-kinase